MGLVGTWPKLRNMCFFITVSGRLVCFSLLVLPIILEMVLIVPLRLQGLGDTFPTFFVPLFQSSCLAYRAAAVPAIRVAVKLSYRNDTMIASISLTEIKTILKLL